MFNLYATAILFYPRTLYGISQYISCSTNLIEVEKIDDSSLTVTF